jgi:hypothetical protein
MLAISRKKNSASEDGVERVFAGQLEAYLWAGPKEYTHQRYWEACTPGVALTSLKKA